MYLKDEPYSYNLVTNLDADVTKVNEDNSGTNKSCTRFWMFSKIEKSGDLFELGQIDNIG